MENKMTKEKRMRIMKDMKHGYKKETAKEERKEKRKEKRAEKISRKGRSMKD